MFGPFVYKTKNGKGDKYFLHVKEKGKVRIYYFSKDPVASLGGVPRGYEVIENKSTFLPMLKKKGEKKSKSKEAGNAK